MSNLTATQIKPKASVSVKMDYEKKEALQQLAKKQNRSVHYIMLDMIEKGLQEAQEQAEYDEYVKNRVMKTYNRVMTEGASGKTSEQVFASLQEKMNAYVKNK